MMIFEEPLLWAGLIGVSVALGAVGFLIIYRGGLKLRQAPPPPPIPRIPTHGLAAKLRELDARQPQDNTHGR